MNNAFVMINGVEVFVALNLVYWQILLPIIVIQPMLRLNFDVSPSIVLRVYKFWSRFVLVCKIRALL